MKHKHSTIIEFLSHPVLVFSSLILLSAWLLVYYSYFPGLIKQWNNQDNSHSYLVLPVFVYLMWQAKKYYIQKIENSWIISILVLLSSMLFLLVGRLGSLETLIYISMWISLLGIFILFFGYQNLRFAAFPFILLIFALPLPQFINNIISLKLKLWSSYLAVHLLQVINIPVYREGNIIDLGIARLQVVDACSGLRYLFPTIFLALLAGHFFLKTTSARLVLLIISPFICLVSNSLRIAVTGVLVRIIDPALAEGFFHDFSGWLVYMFMLTLLAGMLAVLRRIESKAEVKNDWQVHHSVGKESLDRKKRESVNDDSWISLVPYKAILTSIFLISGFLIQSQLINNQIIPARQNFSTFPESIGEWHGKRSYLSPQILNSLWADDYISGTYINPVTGNSLYLLVSYYETQTTRKTAHAPTSCLLGGGWILLSKTLSEPDPDNGRDFSVRSMVMKQMDSKILSNFWFEQRGRHITSEYLNKFYLFWDALTRNRTDGALVRVEMYLKPGQTIEEGQTILNNFLGELKEKIAIYVPGDNHESTVIF
ncbi:VPLPA-CTERM-specific exosortase XrtD [Desulfonatronovibrio magnus]|uniref:VPLPA-CTERM-specific exosortase XrtD n=1 Tax=Desulfonatronovibrio magnus TaxID=698827 RepID=UPI0005EBDD64|nr:VPLPA-CTERM-specific exosortase XrtD [Desulfonatronovibrio magnus]